jgi:small subunit ribosomal protein S15
MSMTKAKKKNKRRFLRRKKFAEVGIPIPLPGSYIPRDTPVVAAADPEQVKIETLAHDQQVTLEIQAKLETQKKIGPVLRHHMTGLVMSDRVRKLFDLVNGNQKEVVAAQKHRGMELFQLRPGDTGSSAVQVVALTTRIQQMQMHMMTHKKDKHSKRGLDAMYVRRRKILDYLEREDFDSYRRVVKTLALVR